MVNEWLRMTEKNPQEFGAVCRLSPEDSELGELVWAEADLESAEMLVCVRARCACK